MSAVVIKEGLIHYEAFGRGKPVVFIHGWLGSWRYWMRTMEALASDYRTYALDLWGFGDSDKSKERYSVADYTALLYDFTDHLGLVNASLVGHSLGAIVALHFATQQPALTSRLAVVSLPVTPGAISSRLLDFASNSVLTKMFWRRALVTPWEPSASYLTTRAIACGRLGAAALFYLVYRTPARARCSMRFAAARPPWYRTSRERLATT